MSARAMSYLVFHLFDEFRREAATLPDITAVREWIQNEEVSPEWSLVDSLVLHNGRVFVPTASMLLPDQPFPHNVQCVEARARTLDRLVTGGKALPLHQGPPF